MYVFLLSSFPVDAHVRCSDQHLRFKFQRGQSCLHEVCEGIRSHWRRERRLRPAWVQEAKRRRRPAEG